MLEDLLKRTDVPDDVKEEIRRNISEIEHNNNNNNNNKYRSLFEHANDAIIIADSKTGTILDANKNAETMLGYSREEIIGMNQSKLHPQEKTEHYKKHFEDHIQKENVTDSEAEVVRKDGTIVPVSISASVIEINNKKIIQGIFRDMTERKKVEQQIKFQSNLLENVSDAVIATDMQYNIRFWNKTAEKQYGWTAEEVIGQPMEKFIINDYFGCSLDVILQKISQDGSWKGEVTQNRRDGVRIPIISTVSIIKNEQNQPTGFIAINRDITERKQVEEKIKNSESKYKLLVENLNEGIWQIDKDSVTNFVNSTMANMLGYTVEEMMGKPLFDFMDEQGKKLAAKNVEDRKKGVQEHHDFEFMNKNGTRVYASLQTSPITDKDGNYLGALAGIQDITDRKNLEKEKEKTAEYLLQSQKMESIGHLAGGIAHDFNNIVAGIMGYTDLELGRIKDGTSTPTSIERCFETILSATERAKDLTAQLLGFARKGKYNPQNLDINSIITEVSQLVSKGITPTGHSIEHILKSEKHVNADATQMYQVIQNIVINAKDAMPNGGKITVTCEDVKITKKVIGKLAIIPPNNYVKVTVSDQGTGIPDEIMHKIFDPFYTTKEKGKGTGLGLSTTYGIIQNHNAYMDLETEVGKGTKFSLYFPAVERKKPSQEQQASVEKGNGKILVVDDEVLIRDVAETVLSSAGYQITTAQEGNEALESYKKEKYDLVLSDLIMPNGMEGIELYQKIKEINPNAKVCIMTGYQDETKIQQLLKQGVKKIIQKPFRMKQLTEIINSLMKE